MLQIVKDHSIQASLMTERIPKLMILLQNPSYLIRYEFVALLEHFSDPKINEILLKGSKRQLNDKSGYQSKQ